MSRTETVVIQAITPSLDGGRHPIKRVAGQDIVVEADVFKEGHDVVSAVLKWRKQGEQQWRETPMKPLVNDRWQGVFPVTDPGYWEYTIEAWGETFQSWQEEIHKKFNGGLRDLASEALEGAAFVTQAATRAGKSPDAKALKDYAKQLSKATPEALNTLASDPHLGALMTVWTDRSLATEYAPALRVWADR